jgi:hypothetical protein
MQGTKQGPYSQIFWIIRQYLHCPKFVQVIICYCFYIWAIPVIRAIFHLKISSLLLQGHQGSFLCFLESSYLKKLMEYGTRGQELPEMLLEGFFDISLRYACFINDFFLVRTQNIWSWVAVLKCRIIRIYEMSD